MLEVHGNFLSKMENSILDGGREVQAKPDANIIQGTSQGPIATLSMMETI